jgi:hypothetical protein
MLASLFMIMQPEGLTRQPTSNTATVSGTDMADMDTLFTSPTCAARDTPVCLADSQDIQISRGHIYGQPEKKEVHIRGARTPPLHTKTLGGAHR